jgi:hypothetical protein
METYYALGKLVVAIAVVAQCSALAVQVWAFKLHRQHCFTLLASGALIGLIYAVLAGIPFFVRLDLPTSIFLAKITVVLLAIGVALGLWGMILLVRSYARPTKLAPSEPHASA